MITVLGVETDQVSDFQEGDRAIPHPFLNGAFVDAIPPCNGRFLDQFLLSCLTVSIGLLFRILFGGF